MPADEPRAVVWRVGDALLAVPVADTVEVAPVAGGRAASQLGSLPLHDLPGIPAPGDPRRAVIVRSAAAPLALPAETVEGVIPYQPGSAPLPDWLRHLPAPHLDRLVRLDDRRIAALLAVDRLRAGA